MGRGYRNYFKYNLYSFFHLYRLTIDGIQYPDNIIEYFGNFDYNDFLILFLSIIAYFFFNVCLLLTCNYFTPFHTLIISIINDFHLYLRPSENVFLSIASVLILILIAFAFLIYIEIIEINICNISYDTKKHIEIRSESESSIENEDLFSSNEEKEDGKSETLFPLSDIKIN